MKHSIALLMLCSVFSFAQESNQAGQEAPATPETKYYVPQESVITHEAVATQQADGNTVFKFEGKTSGTLVGIVKDSKTYNPIQGALVTAGEQTAYTNEHGRFKLGGFELTETDVTVSLDGFYAQTQTVNIVGRSSALMVFKLENESDEVVISEEDLLKIKLVPKKVTVKAGSQFFVFFEAPDGFEREAWIGITKKESPHDIYDPEKSEEVYFHKFLLHKVQGDLLFKAPENPGTYELRMYNQQEQGQMVATHILKVIGHE